MLPNEIRINPLRNTNNQLQTCRGVHSTSANDIKQKKYGLVYGATIEVEIIRQGGSKGEATIHYITESASAEQGVNYEHTAGSVTFADGETVKKVTLTAYDKNGSPAHDDRIVDGKDFYFTLVNL